MASVEDIIRLIENSRVRFERDCAYLRTLEDRLTQTRSLIQRSELACAASRRLLDNLDAEALNRPSPDER